MEEKSHEVVIEKLVLQQLKDDGIIRIYSTFQDNLRLYFLLEYAPNGSIYDLLKREIKLQDRLVRHLSAEIVLCLEYLRNNQIIHRDLKPGNILLDKNYHLKLIDFATSKVLNPDIKRKIPLKKSSSTQQITSFNSEDDGAHERKFSLVGTEEYVSPEILLKEEPTYASDLWSLGIIIFQLYTGVTPFKG